MTKHSFNRRHSAPIAIESVNEMKLRTKQLLGMLILTALVLGLYAGSALAQDTSGAATAVPTAVPAAPVLTMRQQLLTRLGEAGFAQMVARMTAMHGAAATEAMLDQPATGDICPLCDGTNARMGMMGGSMQGRGMMGQGQGMMRNNGMGQGAMMGRNDGAQRGYQGDNRGAWRDQSMRGPGMMRGSWMGENGWLPNWMQQGWHDFMGWNMGRFAPNVPPTPTPAD